MYIYTHMAILLKELTINYSPEKGKTTTLMQILMDYHAIFSVWQKEGSGGANVSPTSQRKTEIIDNLIEQVATAVLISLTNRLSENGRYAKDLKKMKFAYGQKNWLDFTASVDNLVGLAFGTPALKQIELNPKAELSKLSKVIQPFVKSTLGFPDIKPKEPAWKKYDKPLTAPPATIQQDLPFAGAQTNLPLKPKEKLPSVPADLPPMATPFAGNEPKRVPANWEKVFSQYGYNWDDADKEYKNTERNMKIQQQPNGVFTVIFPSGNTKEVRNLGLLLRKLQHNREKRHKEPAAQVTEANYKDLYRFLYD